MPELLHTSALWMTQASILFSLAMCPFAAYSQTTTINTKIKKCEPTIDACAILASNSTTTLLNHTGGPGNIDSIQIAVANGNNLTTMNSRLKVFIDGNAIASMDVDLGTFYLAHGA